MQTILAAKDCYFWLSLPASHWNACVEITVKLCHIFKYAIYMEITIKANKNFNNRH